VPAFDISAACSGFLYGLTVGSQFIQSGMYKRVLVIGAESLTRFTDYTDRGSCILFGDGAGAAVLEAVDDGKSGIIYNVLHADGPDGTSFTCPPAGRARRPATQPWTPRLHYVKLRGRDVYKFAVEKDAVAAGGLHEAVQPLGGRRGPGSSRTKSTAASSPPHGEARFPDREGLHEYRPLRQYIAASIPLAMADARGEGLIKAGSLLLLVAFGAGLTWAGTVVRM